MNRLTVKTNTKEYEIVIYDSFINLINEINKLKSKFSKICIVSDTLVGKIYFDEVSNYLKKLNPNIHLFSFPNGEINKKNDTILSIYNFLIENKFDRKSLLIALGGGVTGDMVGFVAATFMRGISYIQIPTTLLAQVDSSVGGKTGYDFNGYKNIIGAFYQPELVYINTSTLDTLPKREFNAGMAEVIKYGLISDRKFLEYIKDNINKIKNLDKEVLNKIILTSCKIKQKIVSEDEKEIGKRALLNFGHTIGHAIERLKNFKLIHGECVSIGMISALNISKELEYISNEDVNSIISLLKSFELPVNVSDLSKDQIYDEIFHDKKTTFDNINFILLKKMGESYIDFTLNKDIIIKGIDSILKK